MKPDVTTGPIATQSVKQCNLHSCTKEDIQNCFENAYGLDEWLFTSLKDESVFYEVPDTLRLPLIFYYAHPAAVFVNKMLLAQLIPERVNEYFETLFETGVDEMSWDDTENYRMGGAFQWPTVEEARKYRLQVRELVTKVIKETPLELPITQESKWWAIMMGIDHERIHLETSSVLIRQLPVDMVEKPEGWKYAPLVKGRPGIDNPLVTATSTTVTIGKDFDAPTYGWDNEYGKRVLQVPDFEASKYPITNKEFLEFVKDGGYSQRELWTTEGWKWKSYRQAKHPTFWVCSQECKSGCGSTLASYTHCKSSTDNKGYGLRRMFDVITLPEDLPVEVNYLEAKAFCAWKGKGYRLPTEAEHHVMRGELKDDNKLGEEECNLNMTYGSSTPVDMYAPSSTGFCDVFGNVWEWVEDHFNGLPGSSTHYLYDDFSSPCYDGKHTMMLGGSWVSTGDEATRYARFSFRRHFFQHMGFRVARTKDMQHPSPVVYVTTPVYIKGVGEEKTETESRDAEDIGLDPIRCRTTCSEILNDNERVVKRLVDRQCQLGDGFYANVVKSQLHINGKNLKQKSRALVIGCGPGRLAFELTKNFDEVIGCDTSGRCIDLAEEIKGKFSKGEFNKNGTDTLITDVTNHKESIEGLDGIFPEKVLFKQLTWLSCELGRFSLVVVDGLDRVANQKAWLARLPTLMKGSDSVVVLLHAQNGEDYADYMAKQFQPVKQINGDVMANGHDKYKNTYSLWKLPCIATHHGSC